MAQMVGRALSSSQRADLWNRWKSGQSLNDIAPALGKFPASIRGVVSSEGGIAPHIRWRSRLALSLSEREEISRGIAMGDSMRTIAAAIKRAPSSKAIMTDDAQVVSGAAAASGSRTIQLVGSLDGEAPAGFRRKAGPQPACAAPDGRASSSASSGREATCRSRSDGAGRFEVKCASGNGEQCAAPEPDQRRRADVGGALHCLTPWGEAQLSAEGVNRRGAVRRAGAQLGAPQRPATGTRALL